MNEQERVNHVIDLWNNTGSTVSPSAQYLLQFANAVSVEAKEQAREKVRDRVLNAYYELYGKPSNIKRKNLAYPSWLIVALKEGGKEAE